MGSTREKVCKTTAQKLAEATQGPLKKKAVVGLDGFVDSIISVVDKRYSCDHYDPVRTISALAVKIQHAAGESSNYELVVKQRKLGGNGPIMANALASLGFDVAYIGSLGYPTCDPVFDVLARRAKVYSVAEAGHTDALEFDDGKLMLGKYESLNEVTWENLLERIGRDELFGLFKGANLVGLVNWTMLPQMSRIWTKLMDEVYTPARKPQSTLFIDLADPEKRTPQDIAEALGLLSKFQERVDVVLGLNLKEATEVEQVLGFAPRKDPEAALVEVAGTIREAVGLSCVVVHPRRSAAAATAHGSAWFRGPFIELPLISTGAGDHFNAGFCLGRTLGFTLEECLCAGVATSGYYVRTARSPSGPQLAEFCEHLPAPEND